VSYKATNWAYELPITGSKKSVLIALADMADEQASCFPGHERIAAMTGRSKSTVERAVKDLESMGLLTRSKRHDARGWRTSDRYHLCLTVNLPSRQPADSATRLVGSVQSLTVNLLPPTRHHDEAEPLVEPLEEPSEKKSTKGSRISPEWWPSEALLEWAAKEIPLIDALGETPNFVDWWVSAAGAKAVKLDWDRTWKVWMRKQQPSKRPQTKPTTVADIAAHKAKVMAESEARYLAETEARNA